LGERNTDAAFQITIPAGRGYNRYDFNFNGYQYDYPIVFESYAGYDGGEEGDPIPGWSDQAFVYKNGVQLNANRYAISSNGSKIRIVPEGAAVYEWDRYWVGEWYDGHYEYHWVYKSGWTDEYESDWKAPVRTVAELPASGNSYRDLRLVGLYDATEEFVVVVLHNNPVNPATPYTRMYGNNKLDTLGQTISDPAFTANPNKWISDWSNAFTNTKNKLIELIGWINHTKVSDVGYFVNPNIIPGMASNWSLQDGWIASINQAITAIDDFFSILDSYYTYGGTSSDESGKVEIDDGLALLKASMSTALSQISAIHATINPGNPASDNYGSGFFGDPADKGATLWGARAQWIKSVIDANEGSRVVLKGIASVIATMNSSITKNEDEFVLYGITKQAVDWTTRQAWIGGLVTPDVLAIELHQIVDTRENSATFLELIADGYIISWQSTAHATGYDIWRSLDWNGTTGTWTKILPAGNSFSVQNTNPDNGQIYNFYSDLSVDPNTGIKPFYKIKAYDEGGAGDYIRIPAESAISDPKNIDDFEGLGSGGIAYPPSGGGGSSSGGSGSDGGDSNIPTTGAVNWREPVVAYTSLPTIGNREGDVRLVVSEGAIYYWNNSDDHWEPLTGSGTNSSWKEPVEAISFLPTINNTDGDVRLVNNTGKLYRWDSESRNWIPIEGEGGGSSNHNSLEDMPDIDGNNADHDSRYYTENEIDTKMEEITEQLDALKYLIPEDAAPLSGALKITGRLYESGYLSHGYIQDQRFVTLEPEEYFQKIIKGGEIVLSAQLPDAEFNSADKGMLLLYVNNMLIDTFDLFNHFDESKRSTIQTYTPAFGSHGYIKVTEVKMYNNYSKYQKGKFELHLDDTILVSGENSIKLAHSFDTTTHETPELIIFYDTSLLPITMNSFDIRQGRLISNKYMSGLRYYAVNDSLRCSFRIENLFNNTYIFPNQVNVDSSELAISPYWINHGSVGSSYINFGQPFINAILQSDEEKIIDIPNIVKNRPTIRTKAYNLLESEEFSYQENVLINTYGVKATDVHEYFVDEAYRLPVANYDYTFNDYKNQWNSAAEIGANDLQVYSNLLIYPRTNFTINYLPIQTRNYSGYAGDRYYIRAFMDAGVPHNNGVIYIKGFDSNTCPYINVELKLPGQTNWMNLRQLYNEADFNGEDSDGCLINHDTFYYEFTTGKYSTADSGYMILVKITMTENNYIPIEELSINW
jgi:hypothetical protein